MWPQILQEHINFKLSAEINEQTSDITCIRDARIVLALWSNMTKFPHVKNYG